MRQRLLKEGPHFLPKSWQASGWLIRRIIATPPWANMRLIRRVYEEAHKLTKSTGIKYTVGHIVPLKHPLVCGLHVHWNLIPEPASFNFSKGARWCEWQGDLFTEAEQFELDLLYYE